MSGPPHRVGESVWTMACGVRKCYNEPLPSLTPEPLMSTFDSTERDAFFHAFLLCLLWSTTDEDDTHLDNNYDLGDLHPGTVAGLRQQCDAFLDANAADIQAVIKEVPEYTLSSAGHDLALSRNGHGSGFFDCGVEWVEDRLQAAAEAQGPAEAYVGDDGLVYVVGLETFEASKPRSGPRP